jgi:tetratricopeptide (TPR) repeat protein
MSHRALLLGLLLGLPALAQGKPEVIPDEALEPHMKELDERLEQVRKGAMKPAQFVEYYQQRALAKGSPRERAVHAFLHGYVLQIVVRNGKEARREFERACEIAPGFLAAHAFVALLAEEAGDRAEAEKILRHMLEIDPTYVRAVIQQAQMAARQGDLERAKVLFQKSVDIKLDLQALAGLMGVNVGLFRKSFDEKEKEQLAKEAIAAASALISLEPGNPRSWVTKATVLLDLGRIREATDFLEDAYANAGLKPAGRAELLQLLRKVYQSQGNVEGVQQTLERMKSAEGLPPEERERIGSRLKDLEGMGRNAFVKWQIEAMLKAIRNEGLSVQQRQEAQQMLEEFLSSEAMLIDELKPLCHEVFRQFMRLLIDAPPELIVRCLRWMRNNLADPRLVRVLVHYIHPGGKTEAVREEAVRTMAACGGIASVPAIYFCLQDSSGLVVREADSQLTVLCERRSPVGGGTDPFTDDQIRAARRGWAAYFHSAEGGERLAKAFEDLATRVRLDPGSTRELSAAPLIDHAANVLRDNDVPWQGWAAAFDFLEKYWGKENLRPVERRGKPVEEFEREHIVRRLEEEYATPEAPPAPPPPAPGKAGMAQGK